MHYYWYNLHSSDNQQPLQHEMNLSDIVCHQWYRFISQPVQPAPEQMGNVRDCLGLDVLWVLFYGMINTIPNFIQVYQSKQQFCSL
jgi:hypothetical protein